MNIRTTLITTHFTAALALALATAAQAGSLATGPLQGDTFLCRAVNVDPGVVSILTVDIINSGTGTVETTNACQDVESNHECFAFANDPSVLVTFCRITSSGPAGRIRGTFVVGLGSTVLVVEPR